jgi:hypothetical protein
VKKRRWAANETGEKVLIDRPIRVRPWFFEQDNGWYVQCRYGSRVLNINGKNNAVFVSKLDEIAGALAALGEATKNGELDSAIAAILDRKK